ncbi:MAG: HPr kinase/phosphorylase [Halanaerobium sp. 4-GBenrich]|jgi:HPr kinase/phosphorylase|uniref:HPr kinase/phosphorylase n=1 Tax=Halanaerobium congolense TaxID=54121 RepID=A0A1G8PM93_9FIRM|nr:HPr(Ser) kinase/phosphatase [Halanaerobium congolense]KXS49219.1 MAG: HPr kinase/phosphorylase [Halanaerobium sp. T82-1]ODS50499.1 MAG: HPr kinase/phosphorylase [Halanaerobium sp. 4-GBenrich]PXV64313.1 Hpr(Ser) kinase/phosphatase [Halanaerobium congolense]TDS30169.1 Hpr(Ser) kinase/phosphatase [Halanaerobium congolense]SDI93699.1 Hpr(Ser) kinase/phosphatase [Halanaerobium congolense]
MNEEDKVLVLDIFNRFDLEIRAGRSGIKREVKVSDIKRPGIELAGFWKHFAPERVNLIGRTELSFLKGLGEEILKKRIDEYVSHDPVCIIIARGETVPSYLIDKANENGIPVFSTKISTTRFSSMLLNYLEEKLAPIKVIHGVLVDIYGIGVLIKGQSGIGKSETAIELVKRGHRLVADDIIEIKKIGELRLSGSAPNNSRYFLEMRGIGIINVKTLFGAGAVKHDSPINLAIKLERWEEGEEYERLGIDSRKTEIMDLEIDEIVIPVKPGRNLALVLEVAAMNYRMKTMGYNAAVDFTENIMNK